MDNIKDYYELSNGIQIPCIGFGTWQEEGEQCRYAITTALQVGYRLVDTASSYGNEKSVGLAIKESGIPREDIFVTSKLDNRDHGYERTIQAFESTMDKLQCEYLDLYLIHWPNPIYFRECWEEANAESWRAMEKLYNENKIKAIGVSNFRPHHLNALLKTAMIKPMVNQMHLCPGEINQETVDYCNQKNILLEAYSPLGTGEIFEVSELRLLAEKYNKSVAQIAIRWCLQQGFIPLPKSIHRDRMIENMKVFDFYIEEEDMKMISMLRGSCGLTGDPDKILF